MVNRSIDIGQTVAASLQAPTLFTIAQDLTKMQVYCKTDEGDVGQIRPGHDAEFQVDAFPREVFHGTVRQVRMNATAVQNVVTYDTIIDFDNPDLKLFPGMTAYVSIPVASVQNVAKIPNAALRYKPELPVEKVQELYSKYGVNLAHSTASNRNQQGRAEQPGGATRERQTSASNASDEAVVWTLLPDKSLKPVQIQIGLTDHTFTALVTGNINAGDELVTGATTLKATTSGPGIASPQR